jgi:hypothetical protein
MAETERMFSESYLKKIYNLKIKIMEFPRGDYYQIVCRSGDQALKIQESDPNLHNDSRIISTLPNSNDNTQIWMIEKIGTGDDSYEVVNCLSTYVCSV